MSINFEIRELISKQIKIAKIINLGINLWTKLIRLQYR